LTPASIQASIFLCVDFMPETLHIEMPDQPPPKPGRSWIAWMGTATIAIALVILMWPGAERHTPLSSREAHLPFGASEQAYVSKVQIENLALSRAENFLNQEVTTLSGRLTNGGASSITNVEVSIEFSDQFGQNVLRESRSLFLQPAAPLAPGETRSFEVSFEHIPYTWNVQQPAVHVSGILFTPN
jgi:hypothetical protein